LRQRREALGFFKIPRDKQNPAPHAANNQTQLDKWWPVIKGAGIKAGE
jgi:hypothetical protein